MSIDKEVAIKVLSYNNNVICVKSNIRSYVFEAASADGTPTMHPMSFAEIEYINSNSGVFRTGLLTFDDDRKDELYKALKIFDWKENILFNDEIEDIILNPTLKGLEKIINVRDISVIERVRGIMIGLINTGAYDVSQRVINIINTRAREINSNKFKSEIILRPADTRTYNSDKKEIDEIRKQLAKMKELMAQMASKQNQNKEEKVEVKVEDKSEKPKSEPEPNTKKPVGRPPKK